MPYFTLGNFPKQNMKEQMEREIIQRHISLEVCVSCLGSGGRREGFCSVMWVSVNWPPTLPLSAEMSGEGGGQVSKVVFSI